jgi:hypothetical protein
MWLEHVVRTAMWLASRRTAILATALSRICDQSSAFGNRYEKPPSQPQNGVEVCAQLKIPGAMAVAMTPLASRALAARCIVKRPHPSGAAEYRSALLIFLRFHTNSIAFVAF